MPYTGLNLPLPFACQMVLSSPSVQSGFFLSLMNLQLSVFHDPVYLAPFAVDDYFVA